METWLEYDTRCPPLKHSQRINDQCNKAGGLSELFNIAILKG